MDKKLIISSTCLLRFLSTLNILLYDESDGDVKVTCENRKLNILGCQVEVENKIDFESEVVTKALINLQKACSIIEEQPITLSFNQSGWISVIMVF